MGYACEFTLILLAALLWVELPAVLVLEGSELVEPPVDVPLVDVPVAVTLPAPLVVLLVAAAAPAAPETPRAARLTPLAIEEVVTQFEEEGVEKAPAGVVRSPIVMGLPVVGV